MAGGVSRARVTVDLVLAQLRKRDFAVLSTVGDENKPYSAGVNYGVSRPGRDLTIYVMSRRHLQKARNIAVNRAVTLVVPLMRRLLGLLPPPTIQLHGRADILDWTDEDGTDVFRHFWMGRRILETYRTFHRRGETRICFLRIKPDPVVSTYMVGSHIWELRRRMESGAGKVVIPTRQLQISDGPSRRWSGPWRYSPRVGRQCPSAAGWCPETFFVLCTSRHRPRAQPTHARD